MVSQSGTTGSARRVTEVERANLRGNHYNAGVFMPAGGMMAGGTTSAARQGAQQVLRKIADFEQALTANPRCLTPDFERHGLAFPETPEFEFAIREDGAGVLETKTGAWMNLTSSFTEALSENTLTTWRVSPSGVIATPKAQSRSSHHLRNRWRLQTASMRGRGLNDLLRRDLERQSSHQTWTFFEAGKNNYDNF